MSHKVIAAILSVSAAVAIAPWAVAIAYDGPPPSPAEPGASHHSAHVQHQDHHNPLKMKMTSTRPIRPGDKERATEIVRRFLSATAGYRDFRVAMSSGYDRILAPTIPQPEYHFINPHASSRELGGRFDLQQPGSLLYKRTGDSYELIGAMYMAPSNSTAEQLDTLLPLSIVQWHLHINACFPKGMTVRKMMNGDIGQDSLDMPGMLPLSSSPRAREINRQYGFLADGRFGSRGTIADRETCEAAGGYLLPVIWGWMAHLYLPSSSDVDLAEVFAPQPHLTFAAPKSLSAVVAQ